MGIKDKLKRTSRIFINDSYTNDETKNATDQEGVVAGGEPEIKKVEEPLETDAVQQIGVAEETNDKVGQRDLAQNDVTESQLATETAPETAPETNARVPESEATEPVPDASEMSPETFEAAPKSTQPFAETTETASETTGAAAETSQNVEAAENTNSSAPLGIDEVVNDNEAPVAAACEEDAKDSTKPDLASQAEDAKTDVENTSKKVDSEVKKNAFFKRFLGKFKKSSAAK